MKTELSANKVAITNREFIRHLQKLPADAVVSIYCGDEYYHPLSSYRLDSLQVELVDNYSDERHKLPIGTKVIRL